MRACISNRELLDAMTVQRQEGFSRWRRLFAR